MTTQTETRTLIDQRAAAWSQAEEIKANAHAENRAMTSEELAAATRALNDVEAFTATIDLNNRSATAGDRLRAVDENEAERRERAARNGGDTHDETEARYAESAESYRTAFARFVQHGERGVDAADLDNLRNVTRQVQTRAMSTLTQASAGYTVPTAFENKIRAVAVSFSSVLPLVEVLSSDNGVPFQMLFDTEVDAEGELITEAGAVTGGPDPTFDRKTLGAKIYSSKSVRVSLPLIQDSVVNMENHVSTKLGQRIGRITARHFTNGIVANGEPEGIVTAAPVGRVAPLTGIVWWQELTRLAMSTDPAYRAGSQGFMMNDAIKLQIMLEADAEGRPLWRPALAAGMPDTVLGYQCHSNTYMASAVAANAKTVLFGNYRAGYTARQVKGIDMAVLREKFIENLQIGMQAWTRMDGIGTEVGAYKALRH